MLATDRRLKILERVAEQQTIQVTELAKDFAVSEMTIRRDIQRLERDGFLRRTYGGATAHLTRSLDLAFNARALQHAREKRLVAMDAASRIGDAQVIFLGIGTTAEHVARFLPARPDLTVITNSLPIASLLGTRPFRVVMLGGAVRRDELSCIGPAALATLARYHADVAIVGAAGISARLGVTDLNEEEGEVNRLAAERSGRVIVVADGSKLGHLTMTSVIPIASVDTLVTDASAPPDEVAMLRAAGLSVVVADASIDPPGVGIGDRAPDGAVAE